MTNKQRREAIKKLYREMNDCYAVIRTKKARLADLIAECQHDDTTRYADPSGGHDHAYHCNVCGKDW
jgi:hypothetical protein